MDAFVRVHLCVFTSIRLINHKFSTNTSLQMMCQHTTADLSTSPPVRHPAAPIIWTLIGWRHGMQLGGKARARVCVCVYMWQFGDSAGFSAQWGEILSKRTVTQSAFCIQHSRSVTCQPGLCITVMDVLINAAQTGAHTLPHRRTLL